MSSRKREYGGSGRTVTPKLRAISVSPSLVREARLSSLDACGAERYQRRCGQHGDRGERDPPVARELECEAGERRPDEDREDRAGVDERDRGAGCVRSSALGRREGHCERKARREAEDEGATGREPEGACDAQKERTCGRAHERGRDQVLRADPAGEHASRGSRDDADEEHEPAREPGGSRAHTLPLEQRQDRKSTRLNSSHLGISYAV